MNHGYHDIFSCSQKRNINSPVTLEEKKKQDILTLQLSTGLIAGLLDRQLNS
jgi:hypothetical protein